MVHETSTSIEQAETESLVTAALDSGEGVFHATKHASFVRGNLQRTGLAAECSKTCIAYWTMHTLALLGEEEISTTEEPIIYNRKRVTPTNVQKHLDSRGGAIGGGINQYSHLATTFAAVLSMPSMMKEHSEVPKLLDRNRLYQFLMECKHPNGSFAMHRGGETDVRASYTALSVAFFYGLLTPQLTENCAQFIQSCQSYDGGIGALPHHESHGGYAFCGLASLIILNQVDVIDLNALAEWATFRQMTVEGGFQGRTNKLVDGCYSFWVGGLFPLLRSLGIGDKDLMCSQRLRTYILSACQDPVFFGLRERPGKRADLYHSAYCLSGLSITSWSVKVDIRDMLQVPIAVRIGDAEALVEPCHPVFNITLKHFEALASYTRTLPAFQPS